MYLSMRAIGFMAGAMLLHALTDPTGFRATGGIDKVPGSGGSSTIGDLVGLLTIVMVVVAFGRLACIRAYADEPRDEKAPAHV
jgi:hypothetical protein